MEPGFPLPEGRGRVELLTLSRFVPTPESRSALAAVRRVAACLCSRRASRHINPLCIHGPAGIGKTHLVWALAQEVARGNPELAVRVLSAADFESANHDQSADTNILLAARACDLLIVEDLQLLTARGAAVLLPLMDHLFARQQQLVFTATMGPGHLVRLPARLTSRLAGGLVVGMAPLSGVSRLAILQDKAGRRQLALSREVLDWLAEKLVGGGRQLEGALNRLEVLARQRHGTLDLAVVAEQFRDQVDAARPTVARIATRVGGHFQIDPKQMQSRRRYRNALLPRQLSMYLARELTGLSLGEIGKYFGGRDHTTVLHACRKVRRILSGDAVLSGAVHQLQADLV